MNTRDKDYSKVYFRLDNDKKIIYFNGKKSENVHILTLTDMSRLLLRFIKENNIYNFLIEWLNNHHISFFSWVSCYYEEPFKIIIEELNRVLERKLSYASMSKISHIKNLLSYFYRLSQKWNDILFTLE